MNEVRGGLDEPSICRLCWRWGSDIVGVCVSKSNAGFSITALMLQAKRSHPRSLVVTKKNHRELHVAPQLLHTLSSFLYLWMNERRREILVFCPPRHHNETCEFLRHIRTRMKNDQSAGPCYARSVVAVSTWKRIRNAARRSSELK